VELGLQAVVQELVVLAEYLGTAGEVDNHGEGVL